MLPAEFKPVYDSFIHGVISFDEMVQQGKDMDVNIAPYNPSTQRNPIYSEGNNNSRVGFTWHLDSVKGAIFQRTVKPAIIKTVNKIHKWIVGEWDRNAFVYDDPRLQVLDDSVTKGINTLFDHQDRKLDIMHKGADILLFMLKEDIYWRPRIFALCNNLPYFILTQQELENIETFTNGVEVVNQFTMQPVVNHPSNANMPKVELQC